MAFGSQIGSANFAIFPSLKGFRSKVSKEVAAAGREGSTAFNRGFDGNTLGSRIGRNLKNGFDGSVKNLGDDVLKGFQRDVAKATAANRSALLDQAAAANKVKAAEEALAAAISKHGEDSTQAEAAAIRLEKARLRQAAADDKAALSSETLMTAQEALTNAQIQLVASTGHSMGSLASSMRNLAADILQPVTNLASGIGKEMMGAAKNMAAPITNKFSELHATTSKVLNNMGTNATNAFSCIGAKATGTFNKLPEGARNALGSIGEYLGNVTKATTPVFQSLGNIGGNALKGLGNMARNVATSIGEHLRSGAERAKAALQNVATVSMTALAAGIGVVTTKLVDMGKQAFNSYASYEQLVGGVDTLFKGASGTVQKYAADAYRTAGVSANSYMEQITSFSASLISSLGGDTEKAAEMGNMALVDMSDNANKMGSDLGSLQFAYQGFAKQNYTMLDNLKLGYGGTKTEMERLIADANKLRAANGQTADLSIDKFSDVVQAIHEVQTQMDITGTTSKEAAITIEGSIGSMKAAWENWLTALGRDDVDMGEFTKKLVDSIITMLKNAVPRIKQIATQMWKAIPDAFAQIITMLPAPVQNMVNSIKGMFSNFGSILAPATAAFAALGASGLGGLIQKIPIVGNLFGGLGGALTKLGTPIGLAIAAFGGLIATSPELQEAFGRNLQLCLTAISDALQYSGAAFRALGDSAGTMVKQLMPVIETFGTTLLANITTLVQQIAPLLPQIINPILNAIRQMMPIITTVMQTLMQTATSILPLISQALAAIMPGIVNLIQQLTPLVPAILTPLLQIINQLVPIITSIVTAAMPIIEQVLPMIMDLISQLIPPIMEIVNTVMPLVVEAVTALAPLVTQVVSAIGEVIQAFLPVVQNVINLIVDCITNAFMPAFRAMAPVVTSAVSTIKSVIEPLSQVIKGVVDVIAGIFSGDWSRVWEGAKNILSGAIDGIKNLVGGMVDIGKNMIQGVWDGIWSMGGWIKDKIGGFFGGVMDNIKGFFGIHSPSTVMRDQVGKMLGRGIGVGISDSAKYVYDSIDDLARETTRRAGNIRANVGYEYGGTGNIAGSRYAKPASYANSTNTTNITVNAQGLNAEEAYAVIDMHARRANAGWNG